MSEADLSFITKEELISELKCRSDVLVVLMRPLEDSTKGQITTCMQGKISDLVWVIERAKFDMLLEDYNENEAS